MAIVDGKNFASELSKSSLNILVTESIECFIIMLLEVAPSWVQVV